MIYRCIDVETTGLPTETDKQALMEIGWCDLTNGLRIGPPIGELVNPGRGCSIEARAVHHISDADVADAISPDRACMTLQTGDHQFYCAHNIDFEKQFFGGGERGWLCTYKAALRIWTDAPGHKLQELRYFLKIDDDEDFDRDLAARPHRAPDDAYVCAFILRRLLKLATVEQIAKWSSGPALLHICYLKKHKGTPWSQVPADYLSWILSSDIKDRDIRATAKFYLNQKTKP
jgi:exodeoxyribonuclease X